MLKGKSEIAIMVRVPVAGKVKTRLIPALGAEGACCFYQAMVEDILRQAKATGMPIHLFFTGGTKAQLPLSWQPFAANISLQQGEDLGARMSHVVATCFQESAQVVLIGSDIPDMRTEILVSADRALAAHEVVLTPAMDGGYCLLGLKRGVDVAKIFRDMPWSTHRVLAITRQRLSDLGHRVSFLPALRDIDTPEDLLAYQKQANPSAHRVNQMLTSLKFRP
ncbi:MAG: TIGR04282 family arsenosugar biosynthesis glycosyltransferase [Desulfobulbus sp.]